MNTIQLSLSDDDHRRIAETIRVEIAKTIPSPPLTKDLSDVMMTQAEVAAFLRTTKQTVISWTKQGRLNVRRFGRKVLYSKQQVIKLGGVE